jgi:autotransporter-associated beta strand protein
MFAGSLDRVWTWLADASDNWSTSSRWIAGARQQITRIDFNNGINDLTDNFTTTAVTRSTYSATAGIGSSGGIVVSTDTGGFNENWTAPLSMAAGDHLIISAMFKTNATTGSADNQICGVGLSSSNTAEFGTTTGSSLSFTLRRSASTTTRQVLTATANSTGGVNTNTLRGATFLARSDYWYRLDAEIVKTSTTNNFYIQLFLYECGTDGLQTPRLYRSTIQFTVANADLYGAASVYPGFYARQTADNPIQIASVDQFVVQKFSTWSTPSPPNQSGDTIRFGASPGAVSLTNRTVTLDQDITAADLTLMTYATGFNIAPATTQKITMKSANGPACITNFGSANVAFNISANLDLQSTTYFSGFTSANPGVKVFSGVVSGPGDLIFTLAAGHFDFTNAANTGTGQIIVRGTGGITACAAFDNISSFNSTVILGDALSNPWDNKSIRLGAGTHSNNFDATQAPGVTGTVGRPQIVTRDGASVTLSGNITWGNTVDASTDVRLDLGTVGGTLTVSGKLSTAAYAGSLTWGGSGATNPSSVYIPTNAANDYTAGNILTAGTLLLRASVPASGASIIGASATSSTFQMADGSITSGQAATYTASILIDGGDYTLASGRGLSLLNAASSTPLAAYIVGVNSANNATWSGAITTTTTATTFPLRVTAPASGTCTFTNTISKNASATALTLEKVGAGTCVLSGTCTFQTTLTVSAGTLTISGTTTLATGGTTTILDGATLTVTGTYYAG